MNINSTHRGATPGPLGLGGEERDAAPSPGARSFGAGRKLSGDRQGPVQFHDPLPDSRDYGQVDNFSASYVGNERVAGRMQDLAQHYHEHGMSVTDELRDKVGALADAMGISREEGMRNHHNLAQAFGQDKLPTDRPPAPVQRDGFWASSTQLGGGYVVGRAIGTNPVWGSLADTAVGLTGPGGSGLHLSENTFGRTTDGGFWGGVRNTLSAIGNFFADAVGDHSKIHDGLGKARTQFGVGPGYSYAPGALPPATNYTTGQISGTLYSLGRKTASLIGGAFGAARDFLGAGAAQRGDRPSILERRDFGMFARPGQSLASFAEESRQRSDSIVDAVTGAAGSAWNAVTDFAADAADAVRDFGSDIADTARDIGRSISDTVSGAWDSVTDALGFGGSDRDDDGGRDDSGSSQRGSADPQSESRDVRDSGSF